MEAYSFPDQGLADMYLIQGIESKPQFTSHFEQFEPMYNEGVSDYLVDQGMYYPTATNYGYIYAGLESAGDWEDHRVTFGLGGQEIQYPGTINENMPYVYYNTDYGYGQYTYNPYNPYIPGAIIGVDGSIVGPQQYYDVLSYENPASSSAYAPVALQPRLDSVPNGMANPFIDNRDAVKKADGSVAKHNLRSHAPNSSIPGVGVASVRRNSYGTMVSEGGRGNIESGKQPRPSDISMSQKSPPISQERGPQGTGLHAKPSWGGSQLKSSFTSANGRSGFESGDPGIASVHKVKPKILYDDRASHDVSSDHNGVVRLNKSKGQLVVKAFTKRAGNPDAQGNIVIFTDEYNKVNFPIDYKNSKFFVIKSYSEDDVHKSIKYNVWSSTPNGNRKLSVVYEDAQRIAAGDPRGCPIFLFFSVNASGQFCGVAEMIGPVDFHRDMDFWQQDKWSGSFPVKWHIVKDLPNPNFRHIILENNENKPVTNSRDTQEICYRKGLEMLKIYKNHTLKTSLLDDFMYYENRQRIMQEERARLLMKNYENPYPVSFLDPPRKLQSIPDSPSDGGARKNPDILTTVDKHNVSTEGGSANKQQPLDANNTSESVQVVSADEVVDELKMSSLSISLGEPESGGKSSTAASPMPSKAEPINFVTIGSMPVNVNGHEGSGVLTVGTIPLDPRVLQRD